MTRVPWSSCTCRIGSGWITSEFRRPDVLMVIGDIATVEVPAAFGRAEREGRLSPTIVNKRWLGSMPIARRPS